MDFAVSVRTQALVEHRFGLCDIAPIWAFASGGPIAALANALTEAPLAQAFKLGWPLMDTGFARLRLGPRGVTLIT